MFDGSTVFIVWGGFLPSPQNCITSMAGWNKMCFYPPFMWLYTITSHLEFLKESSVWKNTSNGKKSQTATMQVVLLEILRDRNSTRNVNSLVLYRVTWQLWPTGYGLWLYLKGCRLNFQPVGKTAEEEWLNINCVPCPLPQLRCPWARHLTPRCHSSRLTTAPE